MSQRTVNPRRPSHAPPGPRLTALEPITSDAPLTGFAEFGVSKPVVDALRTQFPVAILGRAGRVGGAVQRPLRSVHLDVLRAAVAAPGHQLVGSLSESAAVCGTPRPRSLAPSRWLA